MKDEAGGPVRDKYTEQTWELDRASERAKDREREGERLLAGWLVAFLSNVNACGNQNT